MIKEMSLFKATKKEVKYPWIAAPCINYSQAQSGIRVGFISHRTICHKLRNRPNDESVLWLSCVSIEYRWKTVLNLINNSLLNHTVPTVVISQWYWVFITQNHIHFKKKTKKDFPRFLFSATRNPGFKILRGVWEWRHYTMHKTWWKQIILIHHNFTLQCQHFDIFLSYQWHVLLSGMFFWLQGLTSV